MEEEEFVEWPSATPWESPTLPTRSSRKRARSRRRTGAKKRRIGNDSAEAPRFERTETSFDVYYKRQQLVPPEERGDFFRALRRPLPVAFRLCATAGQDPTPELEAMRARLPSDVQCWPIECVRGAWQLSLGKDELKTRGLWDLHQWLIKSTAAGAIDRQETVSMLPVALLGIEPHHRVLDMCASPGSKTSQALDGMYCAKNDVPTGFVVANDADVRRAYVLAHRCGRLGDPTASLMVTCHNGMRFPNVSAPMTRSSEHTSASPYPEGVYDRIICDVPCSGDGTLRKDTKVWKVWHPGYGLALHPIQLQIALRGASLLRIGGMMTFSTCSFNPIEDEAVVSSLLQRCNGALELVDPTPLLKGLQWRPGWSHWHVIDDDGELFKTYESTQDSSTNSGMFHRSMWAPNPDSEHAKALKHCVRLMPHDNDTGGFFIALVRKVKPIPCPDGLRLPEPPAPGEPRVVPPRKGKEIHHYHPVPADTVKKVLKAHKKHAGPHGLSQLHKMDLLSRSPAFRGKWQAVSASLLEHYNGNPGSARLNVVRIGSTAIQWMPMEKRHQPVVRPAATD